MPHRRAGTERIFRIARALERSGLDAVVCSLPANVLLLTGYWPVIGTAIGVATAVGDVHLLAPHDEEDLALRGWADEVRFFEPGSLDELRTAADAVRSPLAELLRDLRVENGRLGYESGPAFEPSTYAAMHRYGESIPLMLRESGAASALPADALLAGLRSVPTAEEIGRISAACRIAGRAYETGSALLRSGQRETAVAEGFRAPLADTSQEREVARAGGFTFCMSGPNSALAFAAYARSRERRLSVGDLVLLHCNSYADGYWTDITRTYCIGEPDDLQRRMYDAVFAGRQAALEAIRPGACASAVDAAARQALAAHGFGDEFRHQTGHGVGFAAIDHNARPRLHPQSGDVFEPGMVFNVEPAIYVEGVGGLRHCDMVVVTASGAELLTPFQASLEQLVLEPGAVRATVPM